MSIFKSGFPENLVPVLEQSLDCHGLNSVFGHAMGAMLEKETAAVNLLEERFKTLELDGKLKALQAGENYGVYPNPDWPTAGEAQACAKIRAEVRKEMETLGVVMRDDNDFTVSIIAEALENKFRDLGRPDKTRFEAQLAQLLQLFK